MDPKPDASAQKERSFSEHLLELRSRLIKSCATVLILTVACYFFWEEILALFTSYPLSMTDDPPDLVYIGPTEAFMVSIKIALFGGLVAAMPVLLYQAWKFIAPGLFRKEKTMILPVVFFSFVFFAGGCVFAYFLVIPIAFRFLMGYGAGTLLPMLSINAYIGFIVKLIIAFGVVFEMPVFSFVLARMGVLTPMFLLKKFKYAVLIMFIMAAVLTPPDVLSQFLMALPLLVLYFISVGVAWLGRKRDD